ncbi:MAG: S-layer homology domain-containing protein [Candidatus Margulisiibacteriota bacterium]
MKRINITVICYFILQTSLLALPINKPIVASTFLAYPLETITIRSSKPIGNAVWYAPHGHILSVPGTDNISWASTVREGVYPIILQQYSSITDNSYIIVHNASSTVSREEFAYLLALFLPPVITASESNIPDLPENHWAGPALHACEAYGILELYPDGLLRPYYPIKRTEAAKMLERFKQALGLPVITNAAAGVFLDLSPKHWAYEAICQTIEILPPISNKKYGTIQTLSFAQARAVYDNLKTLKQIIATQ